MSGSTFPILNLGDEEDSERGIERGIKRERAHK
jgi:hypothetical protein